MGAVSTEPIGPGGAGGTGMATTIMGCVSADVGALGAGDVLIDLTESRPGTRSKGIRPGKGIKTNIQVLQKLRGRTSKGQLWGLPR